MTFGKGGDPKASPAAAIILAGVTSPSGPASVAFTNPIAVVRPRLSKRCSNHTHSLSQ
jgi:hypothetical protein